MSNVEFLIRLRELNDELSSINDGSSPAEHVDEDTVDNLGQLLTDASNLIDESSEAGTSNSSEHRELLDRVVHFESDQQRVTKFLSHTAELLEMITV